MARPQASNTDGELQRNSRDYRVHTLHSQLQKMLPYVLPSLLAAYNTQDDERRGTATSREGHCNVERLAACAFFEAQHQTHQYLQKLQKGAPEKSVAGDDGSIQKEGQAATASYSSGCSLVAPGRAWAPANLLRDNADFLINFLQIQLRRQKDLNECPVPASEKKGSEPILQDQTDTSTTRNSTRSALLQRPRDKNSDSARAPASCPVYLTSGGRKFRQSCWTRARRFTEPLCRAMLNAAVQQYLCSEISNNVADHGLQPTSAGCSSGAASAPLPRTRCGPARQLETGLCSLSSSAQMNIDFSWTTLLKVDRRNAGALLLPSEARRVITSVVVQLLDYDIGIHDANGDYPTWCVALVRDALAVLTMGVRLKRKQAESFFRQNSAECEKLHRIIETGGDTTHFQGFWVSDLWTKQLNEDGPPDDDELDPLQGFDDWCSAVLQREEKASPNKDVNVKPQAEGVTTSHAATQHTSTAAESKGKQDETQARPDLSRELLTTPTATAGSIPVSYSYEREAAAQVLLLFRHFLEHPELAVLAFDCIGMAVEILSTNTKVLLPLLHKLWPCVLHCFAQKGALFAKACELVAIMVRASGDFLARRVRERVWPELFRWMFVLKFPRFVEFCNRETVTLESGNNLSNGRRTCSSSRHTTLKDLETIACNSVAEEFLQSSESCWISPGDGPLIEVVETESHNPRPPSAEVACGKNRARALERTRPIKLFSQASTRTLTTARPGEKETTAEHGVRAPAARIAQLCDLDAKTLGIFTRAEVHSHRCALELLDCLIGESPTEDPDLFVPGDELRIVTALYTRAHEFADLATEIRSLTATKLAAEVAEPIQQEASSAETQHQREVATDFEENEDEDGRTLPAALP
ncbi:unnamed protein product [Amoebophrya sp. A120]|nr:unnamed protein product [Amoebophrya sp. A120]|eukprot:GSA120T00019069001.1